MNNSVAILVLGLILFGNILSVIIFFIYHFANQNENNKLPLYIIAKTLQAFAWLTYILLINNFTGYVVLIPNLFLFIGSAIEVYCLIQIDKKTNLHLIRDLFSITFLGVLLYIWFIDSINLRIVFLSGTISILFAYLFVYRVLKPNNSKMKTVVGWIALFYSLSQLFRALNSYFTTSEIAAYTIDTQQLFTAFLWIAITYTFPVFYLLILKEQVNQELDNYKKTLEVKVHSRTRELEASLEREKELGQLKTSFISMASHEFRTPLTAINAIADVLKKYKGKLSPENIDQRLDKIKSEVMDMTGMLEDILIIGKSDSQKLQFNPVEFNFLAHLNTVISEYQLGQSTVRTISISNPENEEIMVKADPKWTKHIIVNLLSNAIKYSEDDTPIEIEVTRKVNELKFSFKDYGIGIPKDDLNQIFEPFHRAQNVENIQGTGIGLVVLQKAVELQGGSIEVESEVGVGTTFTVSIPQ